jgi:tetratricopeptide (TPR) repeat protein
MRRAAAFMIAPLLVMATGALLLVSRRARQDHPPPSQAAPARYSGSARCRDCHEKFYRLWSTSHHGLAMQPFTAALAREQLTVQKQDIVVGDHGYRAEIGAGQVRETTATGEVNRPIAHAIGGKNVYYFLTPYERGRLQVLPVAYDLGRKEWYDVSASGLRHFTDVTEQAVHWTDPELTFNTSCHGCHVSQLHSNYDLVADSYRTTWAEPGINCETCHGPGEEHIRVTREAGPGKVPADLKLIVTKTFTHEQKNDMCAPCHARMSPITDGFRPGDRYFDSFDLIGVENRDFYPDGRDLGETYTFTSWRLGPCAKSGQLDCLHCHTSSGRYRSKDPDKPNQACLPCHEARVRQVLAHSHHPEGKTTCIDCHMPKTEFARMVRSDHSMRPPSPAATIAFKSPNACNLCHQDKDAAWSDRAVRKWHAKDYQAPVLRQSALIAAARKGDWSELAAMLAAVGGAERDEVMAVALIRLLRSYPYDRVGSRPALPAADLRGKAWKPSQGFHVNDQWPAVAVAMMAAMDDRSPWVRAAAAETAGERLTSDAVAALLKATRDPVRLPRVRAANALAGLRASAVPDGLRADLEAATRELEASIIARPDDFASQYDLGRLYARRGDTSRAIAAYETAIRLRPDMVAPLVNVSLAYNAVGRNRDAEIALRRALAIEPGSAAAHLNLGMLLGELGRLAEAEAALRAACKEDPGSAAAAYNLAVIVSRDRLDEAVTWSRRASELDPASPKYAYTWAFYLAQRGDKQAALTVLRRAVDGKAAGGESYALLGRLLAETGRKAEAEALFRRAAANARLGAADRARFGGTGAPSP